MNYINPLISCPGKPVNLLTYMDWTEIYIWDINCYIFKEQVFTFVARCDIEDETSSWRNWSLFSKEG